jgi:hypothetical protein
MGFTFFLDLLSWIYFFMGKKESLKNVKKQLLFWQAIWWASFVDFTATTTTTTTKPVTIRYISKSPCILSVLLVFILP